MTVKIFTQAECTKILGRIVPEQDAMSRDSAADHGNPAFKYPVADLAHVGREVGGTIGREEDHNQKNDKLQSRHVSMSPFPIILILQSFRNLWWVMDLS